MLQHALSLDRCYATEQVCSVLQSSSPFRMFALLRISDWKNLAMNEWTCKGSWDLFSLPDRPDSMERGSVCEGQMRLSVNQTHKNVWKRVVTKISVMLHFQSGNFHRMMTTHIKTRSLRLSENMEHVYFPTTREEESQLATEGISNESRVRMTQPTKRRFPVDFSLFSAAVFLRIFALSDTAENAHKHIRRFLVERCS